MKNVYILILMLSLFAGCSISSDPGSIYTRSIVTFSELPNPVKKAIESENHARPVVGYRKFATDPEWGSYYQINFDDGTDRRYNLDGSETYRGIL